MIWRSPTYGCAFWLALIAAVGCESEPQPWSLVQARIGAPADGAEVWGAFQVRVEVSHRLTADEEAEARPWAVELLLNGEVGLQQALSNRSRSFYLFSVSPLSEGLYAIDVALRFPGDDIPGSATFAPLPRVEHRVRVLSHGDVPVPVPPRPRPIDTLQVRVRTRRGDGGAVSEETATWRAAETAVLVVDMWAEHECAPAALRLQELVPRLNTFLVRARDRGALIVHAPSSGIEEMAPAFPVQRARMRAGGATCSVEGECFSAGVNHAGTALPSLPGEPPLPFAGGCDDGRGEQPPLRDHESHAQHPGVAIFPGDGLSDSAMEISGTFRAEGIKQVILVGVHANECLLRRPFAARGLTQEGFEVVLARDLTDVLYAPPGSAKGSSSDADPPLSHAAALEAVMEHFERYVCATADAQRFL